MPLTNPKRNRGGRLPAAALLLLACPLIAAERDSMVVVISLDGLPAYALDDARLPIPTIRRLAREGATAQSVRTVNPTVTWPNHTAMVTGVDASRHRLLYNGLLTRPAPGEPFKVEPWRDKDLMVHAPTVYDMAYKRGLTTAEVDWVAIYNAKTITWRFAELPNPDGAIEKELIARGVVSREDIANFGRGNIIWRDQIWTEAAAHILREHRPNLMLFHLLGMDSMHHTYGPKNLASMGVFAFTDDRVRQIYDTLDKAKLLDRVTLLVVSDHGFKHVKNVIHARAVLKEKGLLAPEGPAWIIPEGGTAMVYLTDRSRSAELTPRLREVLGRIEGVSGVYGPEDFGKMGLPLPSETDLAPDLVLAATPGYAFGGRDSGPVVTPANSGTHGYLATDSDMNGIFVAWGRGIRPGVRLPEIKMQDIGPTVAALLGFEMPNVQGRVLREILRAR